MNKAAAKQTTTRVERKKDPVPDGRTIALQFIDTTWRVALPLVLLCYIGISLDRHFHTSPLYALIGLFVALAMAVVLVYKQIKSAYPEFLQRGQAGMNFGAQNFTIVLHAEPLFEIAGVKITNSMLLGWIVSIFLITIFVSAARKIKLKAAGKGVSIIEMICEGIIDLTDQVIHDRKLANKFAPFLITLFCFILFNNWFGLLPGVGSIHYHNEPLLRAWTADLTGTLAISISAILIIQVYAFRELRFKGVMTHYFSKQPWNPINLFVGLLEILGEFTRVASLALRLFGNIFAGEVLLIVLAAITSIASPAATLPFIFMELFVGFIQAFVFTTLVIVYLTLAVSHHDEEEHHQEVSDPLIANSAVSTEGSPGKA